MTREMVTIKKANIPRRGEIERRLSSMNTIHSPGSWYKEDVHLLLCYLDSLYTAASNAAILREDKELPEEVNDELRKRHDRLSTLIAKLREENSG